MAISISDLTKVVKKEPFDINWNTVLTVKDDEDLNNSSVESNSSEELLDYFSSNDDDAKIFLIVNNDEWGYLYSRDYLFTLQKSLDKEKKNLEDIGLPGETNLTISSGDLVNYICPVNGCDYKIPRLDLQNPRYMCKIHKDKKLVKEKI